MADGIFGLHRGRWGHAGAEAAHALAVLGLNVLLVSGNLETDWANLFPVILPLVDWPRAI